MIVGVWKIDGPKSNGDIVDADWPGNMYKHPRKALLCIVAVSGLEIADLAAVDKLSTSFRHRAEREGRNSSSRVKRAE